jgi:hypothetical protein
VGGAPTSVASPLGTIPAAVDVMHRSTLAQRKDHWTLRRLSVRARRGYDAYNGTRMQKRFAESIFKIDFLHFLKLKCTLHKIAKLKIIYPSTTSAKAVRGFDH